MRRARILEVPQHRDAGELGHGLLEQLQSFAGEIHRDGGDPGDVSAEAAPGCRPAHPRPDRATIKTIGVVLVVFFKASASAVEDAISTSTLRRTNSSARTWEPVALIFRGLSLCRECFVLALPRAERMEISLDSRQRGTWTGS